MRSQTSVERLALRIAAAVWNTVSGKPDADGGQGRGAPEEVTPGGRAEIWAADGRERLPAQEKMQDDVAADEACLSYQFMPPLHWQHC